MGSLSSSGDGRTSCGRSRRDFVAACMGAAAAEVATVAASAAAAAPVRGRCSGSACCEWNCLADLYTEVLGRCGRLGRSVASAGISPRKNVARVDEGSSKKILKDGDAGPKRKMTCLFSQLNLIPTKSS